MSLSIHLAIATVVGLISSYLAAKRGRNPYLWFAIGFLFGVLGILAIFIATRRIEKSRPPEPAVPQPYIEGPCDRFWYYLDSSRQQKGPMSRHALTEAWKKGEIAFSTLVWHEDLPGWKELQEFIKSGTVK